MLQDDLVQTVLAEMKQETSAHRYICVANGDWNKSFKRLSSMELM